MTRREFYKYLKQEKLFSTFCSYLATCFESKYVTDTETRYIYNMPRTKLDSFIKSNVDIRNTPEN